MASDEAFVTLVTNDSYGLGALVLGHSLRQAGTTRSLAILITPGVTQSMKSQLSSVYDLVQLVDVLDSQDSANLALLARPELGITLTKIHAWNLTQYKKAVFLDADCLVLQNVDDLFDREELSAVPDVGWPDCFNTGVFVFRPSVQTYEALIKFALETGSFDGGDQGLLNSFFHDWATKDIKTHLPFIYNMVATVIYSYAPAFKQFGQNVKIVHFLGSVKPWHQSSASSTVVLGQFLQLWWNIFNTSVRGQLEPGLAGLAGSIASLDLGTSFTQHVGGVAQRQASHRRDWEAGKIDYMGADSYENIQRRIQESIGGTTPHAAAGKSPSPPRTTGKAGSPPRAGSGPSGHDSASQHAAGTNVQAGGHAAVSSSHAAHSHTQQQSSAPGSTKQATPPPQTGATQPQQHSATPTGTAPSHQSHATPAQPAKQPSPPPATKQPAPPPQTQQTAAAPVKQPTPPPQTQPAAKQAAPTQAEPKRPSPPPTGPTQPTGQHSGPTRPTGPAAPIQTGPTRPAATPAHPAQPRAAHPPPKH